MAYDETDMTEEERQRADLRDLWAFILALLFGLIFGVAILLRALP